MFFEGIDLPELSDSLKNLHQVSWLITLLPANPLLNSEPLNTELKNNSSLHYQTKIV